MKKELLHMNSTLIASTIGTVGSPLIVISELIKNAVDASANSIDIYYDFEQNTIVIQNDVSGFSLDDIQTLYLPGESNKKIQGNIKNKKGMYLTGSKGLGILSAFLISDFIEIETVVQTGEIYVINYNRDDGSIEYKNTKNKSADSYTRIKLNNIDPEVLVFFTSESELKKLRHNCTYFYKKSIVPFPQICLHITEQEPYQVNFDCEIPDMLYDLSFSFEKESKKLSFKCHSPSKEINDCKISISDFSLESLKKVLESNYGIRETINTRTNDGPNYADFASVPSFEGRILVYEKNLAGNQLKTYGSGVNIYINDFALYSYLSEENDWLGLADFTQRKKNTRLKPHNVFGYVNFPNFDERNEKLRISNERAGFIEDITFKKLMYLLKAVIMFLVLNIDVADKNPKYKISNSNLNSSSNVDSVVGAKKGETQTKGISDQSDNKNSTNTPMEEISTEDGQVEDYVPNDNYTYYKPKTNLRNSFCFTNQDKAVIDALKDRDDISNKIYGLIYELANLNLKQYRYAVACLYRALIESSSKYFIDAKKLKYNRNSLEENVTTVINYFSSNIGSNKMPTDKQVKTWRTFMIKEKFIDILNEYVHNDTPIDMYQLSESWNTVKNYIFFCILSS